MTWGWREVRDVVLLYALLLAVAAPLAHAIELMAP